jgi:hypothetical protein
MTPRELTMQAWFLYQKLINLDIERRSNRDRRISRDRQESTLITGYSGRRNIKRGTRLHLLLQRAYKRYKRRLDACLRHD